MRITIIGTGYVGLVSGVCFSEFGFDVTCVDKDEHKIRKLSLGEMPIYEPQLETILKRNIKAKRLKFSRNINSAIKKADIVFIAVGTPSRRGDGHADLTYVYDVSKEIAKSIKGYTLIVTKSTVPVGTGRKVLEILKTQNPNGEFDVVSNPEFLREGSAVQDFMRPDRIIVGVESEKAKSMMEKLYRPLYLLETPVLYTDLETSELIKYASNAFLALKISYINQMADLCEKIGSNINDISNGIGLDKRIGSKFLHPGPGFGGSCFPKDTQALLKISEDFGSKVSLIEETINYNRLRKEKMFQKIIEASNNELKNKKISILGLSFKSETDDIRDSISLEIIPKLILENAYITVYDPAAMSEAKRVFQDKIIYSRNVKECLSGSQIVLILTEWNEFRSLDPRQMIKWMDGNTIIDFRNIYNKINMSSIDINYISIGKKLNNY